MANRIFIQNYNRTDDSMDFPLLEDVTLEIVSQFSSFGEAVPKVSEIVNFAATLQAGIAGSVDQGVILTKNLFDIPRWKKTDPIKFVAKLVFPLKDKGAEKDIFIPMKKLISYSILTSNSDGSYAVPGISLASLESFQSSGGRQGFSKNAKLISIGIPGVVYLPVAMIERASPTYSKEITESGFPLWGQIDISILGVYPANTSMFDDAQMLGFKYNKFLPDLVLPDSIRESINKI